MTKILISSKKARQAVLKDKKKMDELFKRHWRNTNDPLALILKTHLYIESCLDQMLSLSLANVNANLLNRRFVDKLEIFRAASLNDPPGGNKLIEKLYLVNNLRNKFAHNLNKKLSFKDLTILLKDIKYKKRATNLSKLKTALSYIVGYFHFCITFNKFFPFAAYLLRNEKIFKRDNGYSNKIKKLYPWTELKLLLKKDFEMR